MRCRMSRGTGTGHPVLEGSNGGTCLMDPDPPPRPLYAQEGSGVTTHHVALDPTSLHGRAPEPPCISRPQIPPPGSGGLRCRHTSRGPPWAVNKEIQ
jgi:hypothetical protein